MKALTLTQPWAQLVTLGAKKIETRSWSTNYRGPLAIHAAKSFPGQAQQLCFREPFRSLLAGYVKLGETYLGQHKFPLGCILATCELVGVDRLGPWIDDPARQPIRWGGTRIPLFELTAQERAFGDFSEGRYAWFLANVVALPEPIPVRGALGLWDWLGPVR